MCGRLMHWANFRLRHPLPISRVIPPRRRFHRRRPTPCGHVAVVDLAALCLLSRSTCSSEPLAPAVPAVLLLFAAVARLNTLRPTRPLSIMFCLRRYAFPVCAQPHAHFRLTACPSAYPQLAAAALHPDLGVAGLHRALPNINVPVPPAMVSYGRGWRRDIASRC